MRDVFLAGRRDSDFENGLGTLSAETGAGKPILIDALSGARGERAETGVVRVGTERAEVSAEFDSPSFKWPQVLFYPTTFPDT